MQTLYRLPRVMEITGLPRTTLYAAIKAGRFPRPVKIGTRAVAWRSTDVDLWLSERRAS